MSDSSIANTILQFDSELKFKIVLVGDSNVGKSSIFWRFLDDVYLESEEK